MSQTISADVQMTAMQGKLETLFNSAGDRNAVSLALIEKDSSAIMDYLPHAQQLQFSADSGKLSTEISGTSLEFTNHAMSQASDKLGVPAKYIRELQSSAWGRSLSAQVLTEHAQHQDKQLLVRVVGDKIRGVVSEKYRRYDAGMLYQTFIEGVHSLGAKFYEANWSETKVELRALYNKVFEIETPNNGTVYMAFGIRLKDSSFGASSLDVSTFNFQMVCANGLVANRMLRQVHLGRSVGQDSTFSKETYQLYSEANVSAVNDMLAGTLSVEAIKSQIDTIQGLSAEVIDLPTEIKLLPTLGFTKDETSRVEQKLLASDPDQGIVGRPTKFKLVNALNNLGYDDGVTNERRLDLEELAGSYAGFSRN